LKYVTLSRTRYAPATFNLIKSFHEEKFSSGRTTTTPEPEEEEEEVLEEEEEPVTRGRLNVNR
jgi:hypothetical protein